MFIGKNAEKGGSSASIELNRGLEVVSASGEVEGGLLLKALEAGEPIAPYIHADDQLAFARNCAWLFEDPSHTVTLRIRFKKGHQWWIEADAKLSAHGTEGLLLELRLDDAANARAVTRKLRDLVDGAVNGAAVIGDGEPIFVNAGLAKMLGYESLDEFIASGKVNFAHNIHPDDLPIVAKRLALRRAGKEPSPKYEVRFRKKAGDFIWVEIAGAMGMWDGRNVSISWISDVSERKQAEEALIKARRTAEAANESKSTFLASMSHEIRTPLNGVLGMAQVLAAQPMPSDQLEMVNTIAESGKVLMALLNDVLDISKIEAGKLEISHVEGDLRASLGCVQKLFLPIAQEKQLALDFRFDDAVPASLLIDPVRVRQCVSNLVSNALKFTSAGRIGVHAGWSETVDGRSIVSIAVTDTGIGISEATQAKLFDAFVQADSSTAGRFGGTGLGLAISRRLAHLMGGDLSVKSAEGTGSTFTLTFQAERAVHSASVTQLTPASQPAVPLSTNLRGKRVLLVDDNRINRQVAKLFLAPLGLAVTEAANGQEALDALAQAEFDIVLLDVHMPVMDGPAAIARIRVSDQPWKDVPVIALTADAMAGDEEKYLAMGMSGYVSKPINQRELEQQLAAMLLGPRRFAA